MTNISGVIVLTLTLSLVKSLPNKDSSCIGSVAQIQCFIPDNILWSCFKPNVIVVKGVDKFGIKLRNVSSEAESGVSSGEDLQVIGNSQLLVNCTAPFPIDIRVAGFQMHDTTRAVYVRNAENVFNEATFVYSVGLRYEHNFSSVTRISIFKVIDETAATLTFSIFQMEEDEPGLMRLGGESNEHAIEQGAGVTVIPCISMDPAIKPELVHILDIANVTKSVTVVEAEYDITQGFLLKNDNISSIAEKYHCFLRGSKNSSLTSYPIPNFRFKIMRREGLYVNPPFKRVVLFQNDVLKLVCRSKTKVQLTGTFKNESVKAMTTLDFGECTSTLEKEGVQPGDGGTVGCGDEEASKPLFSWNIETYDIANNDVLRVFKPTENLVACIGSTTPILKTIFCQGETNCERSKPCFEAGAKCPNTRTGVKCKEGGSCIEMDKNDPILSQGMLNCRAGNYSYTTIFFRGFDGMLYLDWKMAPVSALIEVFVPPTNVTLYPHNPYAFGCRAAPFISDGRIQWVIRGKDGSEILLHKNRVDDITSLSVYNLNSELYTVRESNILLIYPNDYDVICMVPMWNCTASMRYHKRINVAAHIAPVKEILISSACIIILLVIPLVAVIFRLKKAKEAIRNLTEQEVEEFIKGDPTALNSKDVDAHEKISATPYKQELEIPRNKLLIDRENKLGEGEFGLVVKGKVEGMAETVAVKTMKPRCEVDQFKGFMSELKIMMYIGRHPYVVGLIGAHTNKIKEKIMYIVVEYCSNGSLDKYLVANKNRYVNQIEGDDRINPNITQPAVIPLNHYVSICFAADESSSESLNNSDNKDLKTVDLLRWAYQIASGMEYLTRKKVVHADLAARNVLINESGTAKITDFGLSRRLMNYAQYVKKNEEPLPWEMFSLGDIPYSGLSWGISFVDQLTRGLRLSKPTFAPLFIYDLMQRCWNHTPENRLSFEELESKFRITLESLGIHVQKVISFTESEHKLI